MAKKQGIIVPIVPNTQASKAQSISRSSSFCASRVADWLRQQIPDISSDTLSDAAMDDVMTDAESDYSSVLLDENRNAIESDGSISTVVTDYEMESVSAEESPQKQDAHNAYVQDSPAPLMLPPPLSDYHRPRSRYRNSLDRSLSTNQSPTHAMSYHRRLANKLQHKGISKLSRNSSDSCTRVEQLMRALRDSKEEKNRVVFKVKQLQSQLYDERQRSMRLYWAYRRQRKAPRFLRKIARLKNNIAVRISSLCRMLFQTPLAGH